ncbi:hypothetical protein EYD45_09785 [Hyunsoonleella flava]|uniref:Copper-binding protein MbnP-like domain-containing protein n=1 Tax=Hyunsoonleella flava TaxID=2527939 RepID=A0A4Q9FDE7_9FLAO|nr:MbnP family protein [Hyunsoonleella flava]TBN03290.1 hypothetical protein EYD45_09785 [Hyunsoonleella flava]
MKRFVLIILITIAFLSCDDTGNEIIPSTNIVFNFTHSWDGTEVTNADFNTIKFTNEKGDNLSITKLRYLISRITFIGAAGEELKLSGYNLVDVTNNSGLTYDLQNAVPSGSYKNVKFTFGFNNSDNYNNNYQDLNSASWNVPEMLGGGYHYMQLEGKFENNTNAEQGYAYHAIRAVDNSGSSPVFQDTFFEVNLGAVDLTNNSTITIEMNIAEWFKNPYTWDLSQLNSALMPNFDAQVLMFENGQNVFSLKSID